MPAQTLHLLATFTDVQAQAFGLWLPAAGAVALAWCGRRRLPVGASPALGIAAAGGAALLSYARPMPGDAAGWRVQLAWALSGLMVALLLTLWRRNDAAARDADDRTGAADPAARQAPGPARERTVWPVIATHTVLLAGLGLAAVTLTLPATPSPDVRLHVRAALLVGCCVALIVHLRRGTPATRYGVFGLPACLVWLNLPHGRIAEIRGGTSLIVVIAGAAALLAVVGTTLLDWRLRRRIWLEEPQRLTEPPPAHRGWYGVVLAVCVIAGLGGWLACPAAITPFGTVLAALAALTIYHRRGAGPGGEVGVLLLAETIVMAARSWLPAGGMSILLGCGVAALYLLWLAHFWQQQLLEGQPWTTSGRLIPTVRRIAHVAAALAFTASTCLLVGGPEAGAHPWWPAMLAALSLVLLAARLGHEAAVQDSSTAGFAACLAALAAVVPARQAYAALAHTAAPVLPLVAAAALLLAIFARVPSVQARPRVAFNCYLIGFLPIGGMFALTRPDSVGTSTAAAVTSCVLLVAAVLVHRPRQHGDRRPAAGLRG
ncbi:MAG: hypothetical protein KKB50_13935 [Planctomycetes bacterium]|nr:hypothetical protein [Planctomycetota bacterium]